MKFGIQLGWHSGRIYVGSLNKANTEFLDKEDRTEDAVWAVAKLVTEHHGGDYSLTNPHGVTMRIHVERDEEND